MSHAFILHSGGREVYAPELERSTQDTPESTDTHFPIPHWDLFLKTHEALTDAGFTVEEARHGLWDDKHGTKNLRYFGLMKLGFDSNKIDDWAPAVALRNAHDKAFCPQASFGMDVMVCDNLVLTGVILAMHKSTRFGWREFEAQLERSIYEKITVGIETMVERVEKYESMQIADMGADNLIMESVRRGVISASTSGKVDKEYRSESHRDNHGANNVYSLLNAFTEVMKGRVVATPKPSFKLTQLLDQYVGMEVAA